MAIRILHIVTYMGRGGLETMLMNYYRCIDRERVQFDFLVHRSFPADYDAEIEALGGRIYRVSRLIPWSRAYKSELKAFFKAHPEYKTVHVHQDCLSAVALKCAEECGIPNRIAHAHSSSQDKNIKYLIKRYYMKQIPKTATHLFACSKAAGDWMFEGKPYTLIPNAINSAHYAFSPKLRDFMRKKIGVNDEFVMGHVGRFDPAKNHTFLINILEEVKKTEINAKLFLIGGGDGEESIRRLVEAKGLRDNVIFYGVRDDINRLLQAMDVFLMPSLYEGLPLSIIEAQAAALPCIVSDKVPKECDKTGLVSFVSLEAPLKIWAEEILKARLLPRANRLEQLKKAGFDISSATTDLQEFYLGSEGEGAL